VKNVAASARCGMYHRDNAMIEYEFSKKFKS
jgi:hypothetical protein